MACMVWVQSLDTWIGSIGRSIIVHRSHCTDEATPRQLLGMEGQPLLCTNLCAKDGRR